MSEAVRVGVAGRGVAVIEAGVVWPAGMTTLVIGVVLVGEAKKAPAALVVLKMIV